MKKKHNSFEVAALIPKYCGLTANTVEDVVFFGSTTIHEMIRLWSYIANSLAIQIRNVSERLKLLQDNDPTDLCHFNIMYFLEESPDKTFNEIRNDLALKRERLINEKRLAKKKIKILLSLEKRAEKKPVMPRYRPHDWFEVGDPVVYYIGNWEKRIVCDNFATAKIINDYRYQDGHVTICCDKRVNSNKKYLKGRGFNCGMWSPEVMHAWEFEYLLEHPDFADLWSTKGISKHLKTFNAEQFLAALAKEAVARSKK